jgi:molecular chaperone DnaK
MTYHLGVHVGPTPRPAPRAGGARAEPLTLGSRSLALPSVVYLPAGDSGGDMLVGEVAARRAATEPSRVAREFKRRVGDPTPLLLGGTPVAAELLMARLLAWVVDHVTTREGQPPASLAVTHPANWGEYKLDLLRQAIRHVDLTVDHLVPEPVAAASFYAAERDLAAGSLVAVYDLGGGTFDAAMVRVEAGGFRIVGRPDGIERLGGIDFDHAVLGHVLGTLGVDPDQLDAADPVLTAAMSQLRHDCVEAKEALSSDTDTTIPVLLPPAVMRSPRTEVRLARAELEAMIRPALAETLTALRRAIASATTRVDEVSAVLLVGGSSRIPLIAQMISADLGRPVAVDARPKEAVALGAALLADRAAGQRAPEGGVGAAGAVHAAGAAGAVGAAGLAAGVPPGAGSAGTPAAGAPAGASLGGGVPAEGAAAGGTPAGTAAGPPLGGVPPRPPVGTSPPLGGDPVPIGAPLAMTGVGDGTASGERDRPAVGGPSSRARGMWLVAGVAALVVSLAASTQIDGLQAEDAAAKDDRDRETTTTTTGSDGDGDDGGETTTSTTEASSGSGEVAEPLPAWGPEARDQFVEVCVNTDMMETAADIIASMDPGGATVDDLCGCMYEDISTSGVDIGTFNEAWTSEDVRQLDPSHPGRSAMEQAATSCAAQATALGG